MRIFLIYLWLVLMLPLAQANCIQSTQNKKIKFNETFSLQTGEMVATPDARLKVQLKGVGREISESGEVEYVELQIKLDQSEQLIIISEDGESTKTVGDFVIKLVNAESFGKTNCQLNISPKVPHR